MFNVFCLEQKQQASATISCELCTVWKDPWKGRMNESFTWICLWVACASCTCETKSFKVNLQSEKDGVQVCITKNRGRCQSGSNCSIIKSFEGGNGFHYCTTFFICNAIFWIYCCRLHYKFSCIQSSLCAILALCIFKWGARVESSKHR